MHGLNNLHYLNVGKKSTHPGGLGVKRGFMARGRKGIQGAGENNSNMKGGGVEGVSKGRKRIFFFGGGGGWYSWRSKCREEEKVI